MNKIKTTIKTNLVEEEIMQKYIVEVKAPKKGQKVSTGGIRENGKMAAQFTNPIPYIEPEYPPTIQPQAYNLKEYAKGRATELAQDAIHDGLEMLWYELLQPVLRSKLRQLEKRYVTAIEAKNKISLSSIVVPEEPETIEIDVTPLPTTSENVIPFPQRHVS